MAVDDALTRLQRMERAECLGDALGLTDPGSTVATATLPERKRSDPGTRWYRRQATFFGDPEWPRSTPERSIPEVIATVRRTS